MNALVNVGALDRQKYIGGSDVAAILGISPWRTPLDVYLDKVLPPEESSDPARLRVLSRGKRMESYVLDLLAEEAGLTVVARNQRYQDCQFEFIAAEIDGETDREENLEIKTVHPFKAKDWGELLSDEVPLYYAAQSMHGLMVTGRRVCIFGVLIGGDDFRIYRVERDEPTITAIRQHEVQFWDRVCQRNPPAASDVSDIFRLFGSSDNGHVLEAPQELHPDILALQSLREDEKRLLAEIEKRERRIKLFMGDASVLSMNGYPVATWKEQKAKRFDQEAFSSQYPDLFESFKTTCASRVFRLK